MSPFTKNEIFSKYVREPAHVGLMAHDYSTHHVKECHTGTMQVLRLKTDVEGRRFGWARSSGGAPVTAKEFQVDQKVVDDSLFKLVFSN